MSYRTFEGTSDDGNFQEALDDAVEKALSSSSAADDGVTWKLDEVSGRKGTLHGINTLTVRIQARLDSEGE